ncbi:MAG TPA: glycyl-radical enzyme activating protein [Deltaproteobacteria bacterium]|nr:glycyl-radical enzyme activating protein [Deltaproteobacteria bacterium]HQI80220.1 glycyl-radical enzyme activating protein [Deltaproteobacteria bacterium]
MSMGAEGEQGTVFNIQALSIRDGPGIRTTLFFKGCPLRCPWCSNPESMNPAVQIRMAPEKCRGCGACVEACGQGALWMEDGRIRFDHDRCIDCLACVEACGSGCITRVGSLMGAREAVDRLLRDRAFYENTRGGITLSGGEPLFQHAFCLNILQRLHGMGVHTAVDTSGYACRDVFEEITAHVDLVLFDVKHPEGPRHREVIGVDNAVILDNLRLCAKRTEVWTRTPLIPGFNDDPRVTDAIVDLAREVGAARCCFLPFHRWGEHKYARLGMADPYSCLRDFQDGELGRIRDRYRGLDGFVSFESA